MLSAALFILALLLVARAWRTGRAADPRRVPRLLIRFAVATVLATVLLPLAAVREGEPRLLLVILTGVAAAVTFEALASLALWGPFRLRAILVRAPFALAAILLAVFHGPWVAITIVGLLALLSYRWRAALGTVALFRVSLGATALMAFLMLFRRESSEGPAGGLAAIGTFTRIVIGMARIYAAIGLVKAFIAFTRDPSLGIRTVTRRLALSHVLVLAVPLAITITLWVATTFLGVNADRALAGRRLIADETARAAAQLNAAVEGDPGGETALRLADERERRWPGTRLWLDRGAGLQRVRGDSVPGETMLGLWLAGLDSLPKRGVVGLMGRRWMGAAARAAPGGRAAIMLSPVQGALDSTVAPLLQAKFAIRGEDASQINADSLEQAADTLTALMRETRSMQVRPGARRAARSAVGPQVRISRRPGASVSVGSGPMDDTAKSARSQPTNGMANVAGLEFRRGRWRSSEFMLTAHADPGATLAGLFANLRENPLQVVPVVMLGLIVMLLLPLAWLDFSMVGGMGRSIARAVGAIKDGAAAVGRGELGHRIEIQGDDDLWDAARQFNAMTAGLERARELEKERTRLESELELARRIQRRLLPEASPEIAGLEIAGMSEAAREVGGDYYDHFDLGGGRVLLVIADVSGKGVPAALLMSGFRASLMSQDANVLPPDQLAGRCNEFLHRSVESGKFVTAFLGLLDASSGKLVYANAGHNPPALLRADGEIEWLAAGGLMLGIQPQTRFESGEATMERGDLLALYTDGVTEGMDAAGDMWGEARLEEALRRLHQRPCAEAARSLVREVRAFEGDTGPADDITVLLARRV
jgi:serine phosphatase RsbU (regulator of sigma subunit)